MLFLWLPVRACSSKSPKNMIAKLGATDVPMVIPTFCLKNCPAKVKGLLEMMRVSRPFIIDLVKVSSGKDIARTLSIPWAWGIVV